MISLCPLPVLRKRGKMNAFKPHLELRRLRPREVSVLHKVRHWGMDIRYI